MPRLKYNLAAIEDRPTFTAGRFPAQLMKVTQAPSKSSGNPTLTWTWKLMGGPEKGKQMLSWTSLGENALFGLKEHLLALGYKGRVDINTDKLIGKRAMLQIGPRKGKDRNGNDADFDSVLALLPIKGQARDDDEDDDEDEDDEDEYDESEDEDEEDEDEPEERPARRGTSRPAARTNGRSRERVPARATSRRRRDEDDDDEDDD